MKSKIEKIEGSYDLPIIKKKLNQVIDQLNSEPQVEGNYKLTVVDLEDIIKLAKKQKNDSVSIEYLMQYCGYLNSQDQEEDYDEAIRRRIDEESEIKDTPEEWDLFNEEEIEYLREIVLLDYSLAVSLEQKTKSRIGDGVLKKLNKLNK